MKNKQELMEQNGFLVAQLEQVQQDLERYYLENLELLKSGSGVPLIDDASRRYWLKYHPREFWVDLREETLHDNWYEAERHGRWAGPKPASNFTIPPLRPGEYIAEFEIVGAITPDMLELIKCTVGGIAVEHRFVYLCPPGGLPVVLGLPFRVVVQAQPQSIEIQLEFPRAVSPSETGESDDIRRLTACFRTVRIIDARLISG
jgi:hypothetical protein